MNGLTRTTLLCGLPLMIAAWSGCGSRDSGGVLSFSDGRFQIEKPAAWVVMDDLQPAADLGMGNRFREAFLVVVTEPKSELAETASLAEYSEASRAAIRDSGPAYREEGPQESEVGGYPAIQYDLFQSVDGEACRYRHVSIETPDHFHQIVAWSFASHFSKNAADFQSAIRSFAIVE